jgi:hypothetical protein
MTGCSGLSAFAVSTTLIAKAGNTLIVIRATNAATAGVRGILFGSLLILFLNI